MIGRLRCESILERALSLSEAEDTEVYLSGQEQGLTRFANNAIHQNVSHENTQLHVRAVVGQRQGRASTNDCSSDGIQSVVKRALRNALLMPDDPSFTGLPTSGEPPQVAAYDEETASYGPETRGRVVATVCREAGSLDLNASGAYRTGTQEMAVLSTRGARAYHAVTFAGLIVTMMSDTSAGWSKGGSWRVSDIDADSMTDEAIQKTLRGRDPRPVDPGEYTVVLDPYAVDDILGALSLYGTSARAVQDGQSWMNGIMGHRAMSPLVSIWDDGAALEGWPVPFDAEGVRRRRVDIVKDGVVGDPVHNSYTAGKEGKQSTGHQFSPGGFPQATNLFMGAGDSSLDDMIASTQRGLYITRFFYTRLVHNRGCVMTGMTRDGVFLIDGAELSHPMKNLRFTQSYVDALAGVESVGSRRKLVLNEIGFATVVPALKLRSFNFTGTTV